MLKLRSHERQHQPLGDFEFADRAYKWVSPRLRLPPPRPRPQPLSQRLTRWIATAGDVRLREAFTAAALRSSQRIRHDTHSHTCSACLQELWRRASAKTARECVDNKR